ncbi:MAG: rhomboid family intramembrane serine protease [Promethearchaeota archaeon]
MKTLDDEGIKNARITQILIILNIFAFIMMYLFSQNTGSLYEKNSILRLFALDNSGVIERFEIWRIITSLFIHQTMFHLIINMIMLFLYGSLIEKNFEKYEFILIYLISGLIGNLFSLVLYPPNTISLGASGAIFGLIGAAFVLAARSNERIVLILALIYIVLFIIIGFEPAINIFAHFFGLLGGIGFSYFLIKRKDKLSIIEEEEELEEEVVEEVVEEETH